MPPPAYLVVGSEELLVRREAERLLAELRGDGELDVTDVRAEQLRETGLPDLRTASLFGNPRAVVIRDAGELPSELSSALVAALEGPPPDATVVLLARSAQRIQKLAKTVKAQGGRIDVNPPPEWDTQSWSRLVTAELARHGRKADREAVQALLEAAGHDVGAIAEKVAQVAAADAGRVTAAHVNQVVVGHGSRGSFAVADAICERDPARAVTALRGVLEAGNDPVLVLGALSYRIRALVAVAAKVDGDIGLKMSDGQRRRHQGMRRAFGPGELTRAHRVLADADHAMKTGEGDPVHVLEDAVVAIATPAEVTAARG